MTECEDFDCGSSINTSYTETRNKIINLYTENNNMEHVIQKSKIPRNMEITNTICCKICNNKNNMNDNYTILSCNHVFHVNCLVDNHFNDSYRLNMIDSDYFSTRKCPDCDKILQTEELMFIHSKFLSQTKERVETHQKNILNLENQFNKIKEELRICYEYKQKLDNEREKSKQIVTSLMTII